MNIQPLGEQVIIRTIPTDSIGLIIVPPSAKGITQKGSKGEKDVVHFVEAEVIAVGPGKQRKGDRTLVTDLLYAVGFLWAHRDDPAACEGYQTRIADFHKRADNQNARIPPLVKSGDKILYHPAVQSFDREITDLMSNGDANGSRWFIIREDSVLAILEPKL